MCSPRRICPSSRTRWSASLPAGGCRCGRVRRLRARRQSRYEHVWEIRDVCGYREFPAAEAEVHAFLAARVWASLEGPRALFDRAVVRLVDNPVPLPGITTPSRLVAEVRAAENATLLPDARRGGPRRAAAVDAGPAEGARGEAGLGAGAAADTSPPSLSGPGGPGGPCNPRSSIGPAST
ncbi:DUF4158 domain-containing protein [Streptomyces sp. NPDC058637]|uniref:DUF4158 domain-containing protein n=1 Tax=Streptomyces sp. NPDC058637 TaxID=3346569 RepID=UPI003647096C